MPQSLQPSPWGNSENGGGKNANDSNDDKSSDGNIPSDFDAKHEWRKLGNLIRFTGGLKRDTIMLGSMVEEDGCKVVEPPGYVKWKNYSHLCVEIEVPVGFRRLRRAMLNSNSRFHTVEVLENKLQYSE